QENPEKAVRKFRGKTAIVKLLQEQSRSGQNIKTFCAAHGIAEGTFHNWKHKYASEIDARSGFATVQIIPEPGLFAIAGGIKIYQPVSAAYLKELLA
ncbi:MAG: hypothetical protein ABUL46_05505, partial [Chitinophaga rupis]